MSAFPGPLLDLLAKAGDRPVFEHGERVVGADELLSLIRRATGGLHARGIAPGDGVGVLLGVTPEAFAAIVAAHVTGARVVGVRPGLAAPQVRHLLGDTKAAIVDAPHEIPVPAIPIGDLIAAPETDAAPAGRATDVARVIHTSGSTGDPKGCEQTYAAMGAAWNLHPDRWPPAIRELARHLERYLVFGTLSSQVMLEYGLLTLAAGGRMVAAAPVREGPFHAVAIERHRATASVITVPGLYRMRARLQTLGALLVSGSPADPARLRQALDVLGPVVFHGYGQTETGMIAMQTPAGIAERPESVGEPAVEAEVRDGELFVRTPAQARGYRGDPDETKDVFVDGWVRTRDLARIDPDGYLYLLGRARDVIIVNANIQYAGPIERVLAAQPNVAEAYVVGAPDERTGEAVHAFVVPTEGGNVDAELLRAAVRDRLGPASVPSTVTTIGEVPVAPSGKPDKRALLRS
ncbi:AMP-dependent synthetase [Virgisporangium aliadipatigenens]|uniref:AMP-dependent synthetase n=1 Tax=Virgisporangium aliadipatigenens TaxID=741659 RepID=A0A8J3YF64_9ACTN|nr:AMP-binding protein [Virgisporangium aliadipatigenens]GIJ43147.1 AMP-dependent synthetase [Virgisporangium aliadipatigenens]